MPGAGTPDFGSLCRQTREMGGNWGPHRPGRVAFHPCECSVTAPGPVLRVVTRPECFIPDERPDSPGKPPFLEDCVREPASCRPVIPDRHHSRNAARPENPTSSNRNVRNGLPLCTTGCRGGEVSSCSHSLATSRKPACGCPGTNLCSLRAKLVRPHQDGQNESASLRGKSCHKPGSSDLVICF